jgi:hypothetical protein
VVAIKSAAVARTGYNGCTVHSGDSWNSQHNTVRKATTPHGPSRPLPIGVGLYVAGLVVTPWFDRESWAYIPRSRALVLDLPVLRLDRHHTGPQVNADAPPALPPPAKLTHRFVVPQVTDLPDANSNETERQRRRSTGTVRGSAGAPADQA